MLINHLNTVEDMKNKIAIFPSYRKGLTNGNPFINRLYDSFPKNVKVLYVYGRNLAGLCRNLFRANIYIFNWPENVIFNKLGFLQIYVFVLLLSILILRRVKIVWIFHNIAPHEGHNLYTRFMYRFMMKYSKLIISLSKRGENFLKSRTTSSKVLYTPHPFKSLGIQNEGHQYLWDFYIWGGINKYKGVADFLKFFSKVTNKSKYRILITGKCNDRDYEEQLKLYLADNVSYINAYIDTEELISNIAKSRYVLFPYLEDSVSSSGALMDSLEYGAQVIGPNCGAFKDAKDEGVCLTFNKYEEILAICDKSLSLDKKLIKNYIKNNTWDKFPQKILSRL